MRLLPLPLRRFLPLVVVMLALGGCAGFGGDAPPAAGCPPVYIVKELSVAKAADYTTRLRGVRDVACAAEGGTLMVNAALLTEIALTGAAPQDALHVPVILTIAAVDKTGREVISRRTLARELLFTLEDAPSATKPLALAVALSQPDRVATVYVGLVGGEEN